MGTPSNFAFVEHGPPSTKHTASKCSTAKSLIRSHAMQQVWEQRRLRRARDRIDNDFEIVFENEKLEDSGKGKLGSQHHLSPTQQAVEAGERLKKTARRKNSSSTVAVKSNKSRHPAGSIERSLVQSDETLHRTSDWPSSSSSKRRAHLNTRTSQAHLNSARSPSPGAIDMSLMDPFNTCPFPLGAKESRYMDHYFQALSWRFTMPKKTWLRYAMHDAGLLHGVLAIAAAHYSFATTRILSDDAVYHHGKTISHVQQCLSDPSLRFSDAVIGAIGRMVICHLIFGSREHFITHLKALERCTEARGGLEKLGMIGQLKYVITSCVAGAATTATTWWEDVPRQLRYPYGPLDYPAIEDIPDAKIHDPGLGSGLRELHRIGFLSDALLDICEAIIALNSILDSRRKWNEPQQRMFGEQCNKLSLRLVYLRDAEYSNNDKKTPLDHMRECVRLVAHFYVSAFQRDLPLLSNISIHTLHVLKETIYRTDLASCWGGGQLGQVLLWVLTITAASCTRPQERECAGARFQMTVMSLGVTKWPEVQQICRRFIYLDSQLDLRTWPIWRDYGIRLAENTHPAGQGGPITLPSNE